jgi:CRISPR system Cascade subunit CasE
VLQEALLIDEGRITGNRSTGEAGFPLTFHSVRAEGTLEVADIDKALSALHEGVGPAKAFGFGLLSLARA